MTLKDSEVVFFAEEGEWEDLLGIINEYPSAAQIQDDFGMLPLHWACTDPQIDVTVFQHIVHAFPAGCKARNLSEMLPFHVALRSKLPGAHLERLLEQYPEAVMIADGKGQLPIDFARTLSLPSHSLHLLEKAKQAVTSGMDFERFCNKQSDSDAELIHDRISELAAVNHHLQSEELQDINTQLKDISVQLGQLSFALQEKGSPRPSTCSTPTSSSSNSVQLEKFTIDWTPPKPLGIVFEAYQHNIGARIKRFISKTISNGVEQLQIGDVLTAVNGKPVQQMPFKLIIQELKQKPTKFQLEFIRLDTDITMVRLCELVEETLQRIKETDDTIRMSLALSC